MSVNDKEYQDYNEKCDVCGHEFGYHRARDSACPKIPESGNFRKSTYLHCEKKMKLTKNYLGTQMKYLYNKNTMQFLIFPDFINHSDMNTIRATSAGFLTFYQYTDSMSSSQLGVECYGESVSLKLKSDSEDSEKLTFIMRMK